jgi:hypothetical protein
LSNVVEKISKYLRNRKIRYWIKSNKEGALVRSFVKTATIHTPEKDTAGDKKTRLLMLSPERFRGDIDAFLETGRVDIVTLDRGLVDCVNDYFYFSIAKLPVFRVFFSKNTNGPGVKCMNRMIEHMTPVVARVASTLDIDAVVTATVWYRQDMALAYSFQSAGTPYFGTHKEALITSAGLAKLTEDRFSGMIPFRGEMLLLQNEVHAELLVRTGYVAREKTVVCGIVRMEGFVHKCLEARQIRESASPSTRKLITMFSFLRTVIFADIPIRYERNEEAKGLDDFYEDCHIAMAELAQRNPEFSFVIKTKWGGEWIKDIELVLRDAGLDASTLPNLEITCEGDVYQLSEKSAAVVCFASTTALEAGMTGAPVIYPLFAEAASEKVQDLIYYGADLDAFEVPASKSELVRIAEDYLATGRSNPKLEKIQTLFGHYLQPLDQSPCEAYLGSIEKHCNGTM